MTNPNSLLSLQSASSMNVEIHAAYRMTAATHHPCAGRTKAGVDAVQQSILKKCSACPVDEMSVSQPTVDCSSDPSARIVAEFFAHAQQNERMNEENVDRNAHAGEGRTAGESFQRMNNQNCLLETVLAQFSELEMEGSPMQLALIDAYRSRDPALSTWQRETTVFVRGLASKLYGTLTESNLRKAMRSTDVFLSIGILFATLEAQKGPRDFLDALKGLGIGGVAETTAKLIRSCGSLPADSIISAVPIDEARQNDEVARACVAQESAFTALALILRIVCWRAGLKIKIQLGKWILNNTQSGRMIQGDPAAYLGRETLDAEEILALVIPVELGLLSDLPHFGKDPVTGTQSIRAMPDLSVFQVTAAKFSEVARSLQTLTNRIPADLRLGMGHDWLKDKVMIVDFDSEKPRKAKTTDK